MSKLTDLATMAWHVPPSQIARRLELAARRRIEVRSRERLTARLNQRIGPVQLRSDAPHPFMRARKEGVVHQGQALRLTFLNDERTEALPIDWHRDVQDPQSQLWRMNLHYMEYLEGMSDRLLADLVEDWTRNNPPYRPGYWLDAWNSYSLSIRVVVWMQQLARRPRLRRAAREALLESTVQQLLFLEEHLETDIGGNHLLKNIKALLWGAAALDTAHAERWRLLAEKLLAQQLTVQVLADGTHYERSLAYHAQVTVDLLACWLCLAPGELQDHLGRRLLDMAQVLADTTHPDGLCSQFNDSGLHMSWRTDDVLDAVDTLLGQRITPRASFSLDAAGYSGLRSPGELLLVDHGLVGPPQLPGHSQGDCLAIEFSTGGRRIFVDTGVFEYNAGPRRDRSRSTAAHNTVTLNDEDQCRFFGSFRAGRRLRILDSTVTHSPGTLRVDAAHDGYRTLSGRPVHRRVVSATPGQFRIDDTVSGGACQRVTARLLLAPGCTVALNGNEATIAAGPVRLSLRCSHPMELVPAPYFPDFGVEQATHQLVAHYGDAPSTGWWTVRRTA